MSFPPSFQSNSVMWFQWRSTLQLRFIENKQIIPWLSPNLRLSRAVFHTKVAHWVKCWSAYLPAEGGNLLDCKRSPISHSFLLSPSHHPDTTEMLLKSMSYCKSSIHSPPPKPTLHQKKTIFQSSVNIHTMWTPTRQSYRTQDIRIKLSSSTLLLSQ